MLNSHTTKLGTQSTAVRALPLGESQLSAHMPVGITISDFVFHENVHGATRAGYVMCRLCRLVRIFVFHNVRFVRK